MGEKRSDFVNVCVFLDGEYEGFARLYGAYFLDLVS